MARQSFPIQLFLSPDALVELRSFQLQRTSCVYDIDVQKDLNTSTVKAALQS